MAPNSHLANGHMLDFQRRPRRGKPALPDFDWIDSREDAVELGTRSESNSFVDGTKSPSSQRKPTRLPVLKVFVDKDRVQQNDTAASPQQRERDLPTSLQSKIPRGPLDRNSPKSSDHERERYWRRVRHKLDRDNPPSQHKEKQVSLHHGAYRKIISLASSPRQEMAKHKWKTFGSSSNERLHSPDASPATKSDNTTPERGDRLKESAATGQDRYQNEEKRTNSENSACSGGSGASSSLRYKTDHNTDSSCSSTSSVSPISDPTTSVKEWEDRFVVHMPSAREPNPPTMNVHQIAEYQRSIDKIRKEGGAMLDPDTLPSPPTTSPEGKFRPLGQSGKYPGTLDGQDSQVGPSNLEGDGELTYLPTHRRYYCPDEVGKQRFSTIWEESSRGPKQKSSQANPDGSFLGCKEINGPDVRNPDEILHFSTPERPKVVDIPSHLSRLPRESKVAAIRQMKGASGETSLVQEEWEPISQNLKHAQCSKPSPKLLCREAQCQQLKTRKSANTQERLDRDSTGMPLKSFESRKSEPRADDVFIITPTITRTTVTMADLRGQLGGNPGIREPTSRTAGVQTKLPIIPKAGVSPSGLRRVSQSSWAKSGAPSAGRTKLAPPTSIPGRYPEVTTVGKSAAMDKLRGMRGFTRTPGIPKSSTQSRIDPMPDNPPNTIVTHPSSRASNIPSRKTPISPEARHSGPPDGTTYSPPAAEKSPQPRGTDTILQAKIVDVAELDGQQLGDYREDSSVSKVSCPNHDQEAETQPNAKEAIGSDTPHTIVDMVSPFVGQVQGFCHQLKANRDSKLALLKLFLNGLFGMLEHCLQASRKGLAIISTYNATGHWPKANNKDLSWSFTEFGQALVYLVVLGFLAVIIARAVRFVLLIGTWIIWFARPFALVFRTVSRILSL